MNYTNMTTEELFRTAFIEDNQLALEIVERFYSEVDSIRESVYDGHEQSSEESYDDGYQAARLGAIRVLEDYL